MPLLTHWAAMAWLRRIHRDPCAGLERLVVAVSCIGTDGLDHTPEFVSEDQRLLHQNLADPGVFVTVQITAANSGGGDWRLSRPGGIIVSTWATRNRALISRPKNRTIVNAIAMKFISSSQRTPVVARHV